MLADQPFASFEVCGTCFELRGPLDYVWKGVQYWLTQECGCERAARSGGTRPPTWISFDFNIAAELCNCCGVEVLRSGSRWSVWFCTECKARVAECNREAGVAVVPIGRHSLMNGFGLSGFAARSGEIDAFVSRLGTFVERIQVLDAWSHDAVRRNLADTALEDGETPIALPRYLAAVADVDRAERFAAMLKWLGDRAEEHPRAALGDTSGDAV